MYRFRVFEGDRLVREFRKPAAVTRHIKRNIGVFDFIVIAGYAEVDSDELAGPQWFSSALWLEKDVESFYRRRMRLEGQAKYDAQRRQGSTLQHAVR